MLTGRRSKAGAGGNAAKPPVVGGSWLFGAARDFRRDQLGTYGRALKAYGGELVRFRIGPPRVGVEFDTVFQPAGARQVLATGAAAYDKSVPAFDEFRWVMGTGLLTSEGELWRRDRRIVAPLFTRRRVTAHVGTMALAATRLAATWEHLAAEGGQVDLHDAGMHYALQRAWPDGVRRRRGATRSDPPGDGAVPQRLRGPAPCPQYVCRTRTMSRWCGDGGPRAPGTSAGRLSPLLRRVKLTAHNNKHSAQA